MSKMCVSTTLMLHRHVHLFVFLANIRHIFSINKTVDVLQLFRYALNSRAEFPIRAG